MTASNYGLYDFSARCLQTSLGRFTTIDPLAEKYPSVSPYAYCNGNPVNFVDPDGMDWLKNMETWQYEWRDDILIKRNAWSIYRKDV